MSIAEIVEAAEQLSPADFLALRNALDQLEEQLWERESTRVTAKHRKRELTDAAIDRLVLKRRYRNRGA